MSQKTRVLDHLKSGKTLTSMEAFSHFRITRLAALIFTLREEGVMVGTCLTTNPRTGSGPYAKYHLAKRKKDRKKQYEYFTS